LEDDEIMDDVFNAIHTLRKGELVMFGSFLERASDDDVRMVYTLLNFDLANGMSETTKVYDAAGIAMTYAELTGRDMLKIIQEKLGR